MKPTLSLLLLLLLTSCSPQYRLNRLLALHPELKTSDTIFIRDSLIVPQIQVDTLFDFKTIRDTPAQIRSLREKSDVEMMISETGNIHNVVTALMETELLYNAGEQRRPIGFSFQNK